MKKRSDSIDAALIKELQKTRLFAGMTASEVEEVVRRIGVGGNRLFSRVS